MSSKVLYSRKTNSPMKKSILIFTAFFLTACNFPSAINKTTNVSDKQAPVIEIPLAQKKEAKLILTTPENGTKDIQGKIPITFLWDKPLFPLQRADIWQTKLKKEITIQPQVEGTWSVLGTSGLIFEPKENWPMSTEIKTILPEKLVGNEIIHTFQTPRLTLVSTDSHDLINRSPLKLHFNQAIDIQAIAQNLTITPALEFDLSYGQKEITKNKKVVKETDETTLEITPKKDWPLDQSFQFTIKKGTKAKVGNLTTEKDINVQFQTITAFLIKESHIPETVYATATIQFSHKVKSTDFAKHLHISPKPSDENWKKYLQRWTDNEYEARYFQIQPFGKNWDPTKAYKITIDSTLTDIYGRELGKDLEMIFTVLFGNQIKPIYFPAYNTVFPSNIEPKFVFYATGKSREIRVELTQDIPINKSASVIIKLQESLKKKTTFSLNLLKDFPQFFENNKLKAGRYEIKIFDSKEKWARHSTTFFITDFAVGIKDYADDRYEVSATSFQGRPINAKNTTIETWGYGSNESEFVFEKQQIPTTIESANASFILVYLENGKIGIGSNTFNKKMSPYDAKVSFDPWQYQTNLTATILTDRPLYKPGDTVYFNTIFRDRENFGKVQPLLPVKANEKKAYTLKVLNPSWEEIYSTEGIATGGEFDGKWRIPDDAPLGTYQLKVVFNVSKEGPNETVINVPFHIQKYRKPKFLIQSKFNTKRAIYKEKITNNISAEYAFGGALSHKKIHYTISLFGEAKNCWWYCEKKDKVLKTGNGILDKNGKFSVPIDLNFKRKNPDTLWNTLTANINIKASIDEVSSREISIPFYESNQIINLDYGKYFYPQNVPITQKGHLTDLDENPLSGKINVKLFLEKWVRNDLKGVDGNFYGEWKRDNEKIWGKEIMSDEKGNFEIQFQSPKKAGNYFLQFTSTDKKGRKTVQTKNFWISGNDFTSVRENDQNRILQIFNDKKEYQMGETVNIFFPLTKFEIDKKTARATIERGEVLQELPINFENNTISFKTEEWMSPNIYVTIFLTGKDEKGNHDVRWGSTNVVVKNPNQKLDISVDPQKDTYKPGEEIELKIKTTVNGTPVPASVTVVVVDQTLLALKSRSKLNLWQKFLAEVPLGVSTYHTFANFISKEEMKDILAETDTILAKMAMDLGGGGGKGGDFKPRGNFKDTALFKAKIHTDNNGQSTVKFKAPDNLTTWNIWAIGHTTDNAFGETESKTQVTIPMLISEILPNAFQSGDEVNIGLLIRRNNPKQKSSKVKIKLKLPDTITTQKNEKEIIVEEEGRVFFTVKVADWNFNCESSTINCNPRKDFIQAPIGFEIVSDDGFHDAITITRKIFPPKITLSVADFLRVKTSETIQILPDFANALTSKLTIKISPSIVTKLDALVDIAKKMNYGCTEQRMSFYTGILLQKELNKVLGKENSEIDTALLKKSRDYIESTFVNSGFGFWRQSDTPNTWVTANVLENAELWKKYGAPFNEEKLSKARQYLHQEILSVCKQKGWDCISDTTRNYAAAVIAPKNILTTDDLDFLTQHAKSVEAKIWWIRAARLVQKHGVRLSPDAQDFQEKAWTQINKHLKARDRYIFWEEADRSFYSQNERLSAIILEEMIKAHRHTELQHKAVRYLTETKSKNLSGNSSLRLLKTLKIYAEKNEISNVGSEITVKDNLGEALLDTTLEKLNTVAMTEMILSDKNFKAVTLKTKNHKPFYADIALHEVFPVEKITPVSKGFFIERAIYDINDTDFKKPLTQLKQGQNYIVRLRIINNANHRQIALIDHIPAGAEFINFEFDNVDKTLKTLVQGDQCYGWCRPNFDHQEFHETEARFFTNYLSAGTHEIKYLIRSRMTGKFEVMPAKIEEMYFPEVFATTKGEKITITQ